MTRAAATISVYGKVQGVGFRYHTSKKAAEFNISGFVRNKPDGSVYIEAEGEEIDLLAFIDWCEVGPQWSRVIKIETQTIPPLYASGFQIK
ncbi:MAG: acylphosphatase [Bacteroidetes bacterium]|nr:acylphosphatase [Bacteroidota bacterium]